MGPWFIVSYKILAKPGIETLVYKANVLDLNIML